MEVIGLSQVVVKRKHELSEDELMHYKYIKKEKKNGKTRYYYDTDQLRDDIDTFKTEASRTIDNGIYDAEYEILKLSKKKELHDADREHKDNELARKTKRATVHVSNAVKVGKNRALRILNNMGEGRLDNAIKERSRKAKKWLEDLFD